jgi:hypothetical protein
VTQFGSQLVQLTIEVEGRKSKLAAEGDNGTQSLGNLWLQCPMACDDRPIMQNLLLALLRHT